MGCSLFENYIYLITCRYFIFKRFSWLCIFNTILFVFIPSLYLTFCASGIYFWNFPFAFHSPVSVSLTASKQPPWRQCIYNIPVNFVGILLSSDPTRNRLQQKLTFWVVWWYILPSAVGLIYLVSGRYISHTWYVPWGFIKWHGVLVLYNPSTPTF